MEERVIVRVAARVVGRVQGVSFRAATAEKAAELGLSGFVRNRVDGAVDLEAEGPQAAVLELVAWCRRGPPAAKVAELTWREMDTTGEAGPFRVAWE